MAAERKRKRHSRVIKLQFEIIADTRDEVHEATQLLFDELDAVPDNLIDVLNSPGNYDIEVNGLHEHTTVIWKPT